MTALNRGAHYSKATAGAVCAGRTGECFDCQRLPLPVDSEEVPEGLEYCRVALSASDEPLLPGPGISRLVPVLSSVPAVPGMLEEPLL